MSNYEVLGSFYDQLMTEEDPKERYCYLNELFKEYDKKVPQSILDLGCGTGSLLLHYAKNGADVIGVDNSEEMLLVAYDKLKDFTDNVLLLNQDMKELDLNDTVDGVICTMDGMNHLLSLAEISQVLSKIRLFLNSKKLFIFDVNTPYKHEKILGNNAYILGDEDLHCSWQNTFDSRKNIVHMDLDFFKKKDENLYEHYSDYVCERAYSIRSWEKVLKENGFSMEACFEDKTFESPKEDCERWVIVARNLRDYNDYL